VAKSKTQKPPFPSEADIVAFLADNPGKTGKREIARAFRIKGADRIDLKRLLRDMAQKGLLQKRRGRLAPGGVLPPVGIVVVTGVDDDGDVICAPERWDEQSGGSPPRIVLVHTGRQRGSKAISAGSRLLARLAMPAGGEGDYEARIIRRLDAAARLVVGVVSVSPDARVFLESADKRDRRGFELIDTENLANGDLIEAELTKGPRPGLWRARIAERHGPVTGQHAASLIAIAEHGLPHRFDQIVEDEAQAAGPAPLGSREDLRAIPLITIDPADARDRDDAVWAAPDTDKNNAGGHRVIVAIADVAHFVAPGSALDSEAQKRGNSVYFPGRVIPMLPEALSNGLCSLNPHEDRAAMAVEMIFDKRGRKLSHRFTRAMIKTAAALSYGQAQASVNGNPDDVTGPLLEGVLKPLWAAYGALRKGRVARAPLELNLPERRIEIGQDGRISRIFVPERLDAHMLIEEFMIQANVAAAESLEAANLPLIYRVHETPPLEKIKALADFLDTLGIRLASRRVRKPDIFNDVLAKVTDKDLAPLVNQVILRAQTQAVYTADNLGHFGLNLRRYAHFTSPIRRYADLMVHRALIAAAENKAGIVPEAAQLEALAEHISMTERRAMAAERQTADRLIAAYMADRTGAVFSGLISGMTRGALFVELPDTGAEGIVPVSTLRQDYFRYNERARSMTGRNTGETYKLGDKVEIKLVEAAPVSGALKFEMLSPGSIAKTKRRKSKTKSATRKRKR
jgi:ribonuclease R